MQYVEGASRPYTPRSWPFVLICPEFKFPPCYCCAAYDALIAIFHSLGSYIPCTYVLKCLRSGSLVKYVSFYSWWQSCQEVPGKWSTLSPEAWQRCHWPQSVELYVALLLVLHLFCGYWKDFKQQQYRLAFAMNITYNEWYLSDR